MKRTTFIALLLALPIAVNAQLRLPSFFSDGMVLQRNTKIPVWGWTNPNEQVTVTLNGKEAVCHADADGKWKVYLPKMKEGGPYTLKAKSGAGNAVTVNDILIGDVFLCSGQSNMELPISRCMDAVSGKVKDYSNANVRYLKIPQQYNYIEPNEDMKSESWQKITPQTCGNMGAVSYFTGRYLQEAENVPIGIINSSVGGTKVECWMDKETLSSFPEYTEELKNRKYHQPNWVDSIRSIETKAGNEWERQCIVNDPIINNWTKPDYDFSSWKETDIFSHWENGHGSYWFRKVVNIPRELAGKQAVLRLGAMKDADFVFVNGKAVGNTSYEYPPRIYTVPSGLLHEGSNDIMIKLVSQNGTANFTKDKLYQLEIDGQTIPLDEKWMMARGSEMPSKPYSTYFVDTPTGLYNAMIAPFEDFAISGAVWYQGESNCGNPQTYASLLEKMVGCWRKQFNKDFPIVIVQLANYMQRHDQPLQNSGWCSIRQAQLEASEDIDKAAIATAVDLGEWNDIHPQRKDELGRRVAMQLEKLVYKNKDIVAEGPHPVSAKLKGDKVILKFDKKTGKLRSSSNLSSIALAGSDGVYHWANAKTEGDYAVSVDVPYGMSPKSLRYAWDDDPLLSIFNMESLPAPMFQIEIK